MRFGILRGDGIAQADKLGFASYTTYTGHETGDDQGDEEYI